jgi:hypothetical protein
LLTNFLLPKGAPQITVVQESRFGPAITYEAKFPLPHLPADAEIVQRVIDLPPGWRMERAYNGFTANLIVDGELSYQIGPVSTVRPAASKVTRPVRIIEPGRDQHRAFQDKILPVLGRAAEETSGGWASSWPGCSDFRAQTGKPRPWTGTGLGEDRSRCAARRVDFAQSGAPAAPGGDNRRAFVPQLAEVAGTLGGAAHFA